MENPCTRQRPTIGMTKGDELQLATALYGLSGGRVAGTEGLDYCLRKRLRGLRSVLRLDVDYITMVAVEGIPAVMRSIEGKHEYCDRAKRRMLWGAARMQRNHSHQRPALQAATGASFD